MHSEQYIFCGVCLLLNTVLVKIAQISYNKTDYGVLCPSYGWKQKTLKRSNNGVSIELVYMDDSLTMISVVKE